MGKISGAQAVADDVLEEVERASTKFPLWPTDPLHAVAIVNEEVGELNKALLQEAYELNEGITQEDIRKEAVQSAAMLIRFIVSLDRDRDRYSYDHPIEAQHAQ